MKKILFISLLLPVFVQAQIISTIAGNGLKGYNGDDIIATTARLNYPEGVAVDGSGDIYIADHFNNRIRKVSSSTGIISTVAGTGDAQNNCISGEIDGVPATTDPIGSSLYVAADVTGNFYTSCYIDHVRKISSGSGIISTITDVKAISVAIDNEGNLYITGVLDTTFFTRIYKRTASTGIISVIGGNDIQGYAGDGGEATAAEFNDPNGITIDAIGNVYVADQANNAIRKISVGTGIITTIAGNGSLGYSGDGYAATSAELNTPCGVAVDASGNVYIADGNNHVIRKVTVSTGIITTIAGNGIPGYGGDGGLASASQLNQPSNVVVDESGNLYIADAGNNRIRKITSFSSSAARTSGINAYPNPVTSELAITATEKINQITITNQIGKTVYTNEYDDVNVQIDVADLPTGLYFVKINGTEVRKFVKQ